MTPLYIIITIVTFIVVLGVLVLVHEMGHFLTARLFGVRVEEFGIGFPPRVYPRRAVAERMKAEGKTVYSLNALPLGGFVRLSGETGLGVPRAAGTGPQSGDFSLSGRVAPPDDPHAFANKPAWQRAIVLVAGAFNNMLLAMVLVFVTFAIIGTPHTSVAVVGVAQNSPAARAGLTPGDVIRSVDGRVPQDPTELKDLLSARQGRLTTLQVVRGSGTYTVQLVPRVPAAVPCDQGAIGVMTNPVEQHYVPAGPGRAFSTALRVPGTVAGGIFDMIGQLASGRIATQPSDTCPFPSTYLTFGGRLTNALNVGMAPGAVHDDPCLRTSGSSSGFAGPIGIIRQVGCEANTIPTQGWVPLLTLVALLSADLAIVNLLPIPALDGGRLLFVLISMLARRRIRPEVEGMAHALGMAALLTLIFIISWNDLVNLINNKPVF